MTSVILNCCSLHTHDEMNHPIHSQTHSDNERRPFQEENPQARTRNTETIPRVGPKLYEIDTHTEGVRVLTREGTQHC